MAYNFATDLERYAASHDDFICSCSAKSGSGSRATPRASAFLIVQITGSNDRPGRIGEKFNWRLEKGAPACEIEGRKMLGKPVESDFTKLLHQAAEGVGKS